MTVGNPASTEPNSDGPESPAVPGAPVVEMLEVAVSGARREDSAALEGVNWTVRERDFWAVAGLPGSGKGQLLQTAAGLIPPARGMVRLFGEELAGPSGRAWLSVRERVGFVFSGGGRPFQDLTVAQNVALPLCYRGGCRDEEVSDRVQRVLQVIELERFAGWLPRRLNRTSWPRVALGRALILGPELLLLDNPLAGLDPRQVRWWRDFLARLSQGGTNLTARPLTLVVAADDLRPWLAVSRQFGLVREKRWAPLGERTDVLSSTDPLLRELLAELPPGQ